MPSSSSSADEPQTLSIPSIFAFLLLSFFAIRYFFFSSPSSSTTTNSSTTSSSSRTANQRRNFPSSRVDQVEAMFPQLARRDIEWDLVQNGGSMQATTERVLSGGRLAHAPPNFTALYANPPASISSPSSTNPRPSNRPQNQTNPNNYDDLITRYNLSSRVVGDDGSTAEDNNTDPRLKNGKGAWSSSKSERQALLKRRRDEMVLEARRRIVERERKGKGPAP